MVDYVVCDQNLLGRISRLNILEPAFGSVHAPLSMTLNCELKTIKGNNNVNVLPKPPKLIWDTDKRDIFQQMLEQNEFQEILLEINEVLLDPLCTKSEAEAFLTDL